MVRCAIRYFSKALQDAQLNWFAREKECYAIYNSVKQFKDLLDNRHFILKTDHKTSISWMFLGKKYINMCLMRYHVYARIICLQSLR